MFIYSRCTLMVHVSHDLLREGSLVKFPVSEIATIIVYAISCRVIFFFPFRFILEPMISAKEILQQVRSLVEPENAWPAASSKRKWIMPHTNQKIESLNGNQRVRYKEYTVANVKERIKNLDS